MARFIRILWLLIFVACLPNSSVAADAPAATAPAAALFSRDNLLAWCIVPYDAAGRTPEARGEMLQRLGLRRFAYDWRAPQLPTFERELTALAEHRIELSAVWFPDHLNADAKFILDALARHRLHPQLWVAAGLPRQTADTDALPQAVALIRPLAQAGGKLGCTIGLYGHGGWFGEPDHQVAIVEALRSEGIGNVAIVFNFNHCQGHTREIPAVLATLKPYLCAVNLNGIRSDSPSAGEEIVPLGQGDLDLQDLKDLIASGYRGPIGILNHTPQDAEARLLDNLDGLAWLAAQLDGSPPGPLPRPRTFAPASSPATRPAAVDYWAVEDPRERAKLPLYQTIPAARPDELTDANHWPDAAEYANWYRSHGNDACTRYSPLDQINRQNVKSLKPAWVYHSGDGKGNIQCNPIIVDGVMYAPTVGNSVVAVNAETGEEIWRVKTVGRPAHRGITYYPGNGSVGPRVMFAAGKSLWAVDPKTGGPIDGFGIDGKVEIPETVVAPAVYKNVIVFAGWNQDVYGHDLATGKLLWTFHTVPRPGEPFAETWDRQQIGANCWAGMALDASRGIAFITTGSPKPNFIGVGHRGDNLYGNCVVAIDALTGKRLWHFQEIRHDIWDLDIPAPPVLVTVNHDGRRIDAVAAVTKIGNTLLLDRVSGKPLFPFRLRRAPVSTMPGELTSPYQPDLEIPQPFARQVFSLDDVTDISPAAHHFVLNRIGDAKFGWFEPIDVGRNLAMYGFHGGAEWTGACFDPATGMLYVTSNELPCFPGVDRAERAPIDETRLPPTPGRRVYEANCMVCHGPSREGLNTAPSLLGLAQRLTEAQVISQLQTGKGVMPSMAFIVDPQRKDLLEYLFDRDRHYDKPTTRPQRPSYHDRGYPKILDGDGYPGCKPPWGLLNAIDLNTGKIAWRVPLGEYPELTARGIPKTGTENFGGAIVTGGGLVFAGGTRDLKIRAFDKQTGEELWSATLPFGGVAPPATYQVHGKQYIVIPATGGGKLDLPQGDAYAAFCLP